MQPSMHTKLEQLAHRLEEIDRELASGEAARDMNRFRAMGRERSEIEPVVTRFHEYNRARVELAGAQEMLSDPDMKALAEEEIHAAGGRIETSKDPRYISFFPGVVAELAIPLVSKDHLVGVLNIEGPAATPFTPAARTALQVLAGHHAVAIENATLYRETRW